MSEMWQREAQMEDQRQTKEVKVRDSETQTHTRRYAGRRNINVAQTEAETHTGKKNTENRKVANIDVA